MSRHLIKISDLSVDEIYRLFYAAADLKMRARQGLPYLPLAGKTLAMIFERPSLRTRVTFETAMTQLGGHGIYLGQNDIQLGVRESVEDIARNLERWVDGVVARVKSQEALERFADACGVPVVNAMTNRYHPCQALADCFTIQEIKGDLRSVKAAYLGDGYNVAQSLLCAAPILGFSLSLACPEGYEPDPEILKSAADQAEGKVCLTRDPEEAIEGADVVYTDVWYSMGQESEAEQRRKTFETYQINSRLLGLAKEDAIVMHCLPAHRGDELTDEVIDGPQSVVFQQAENRLHIQKAILIYLITPDKLPEKPEPVPESVVSESQVDAK